MSPDLKAIDKELRRLRWNSRIAWLHSVHLLSSNWPVMEPTDCSDLIEVVRRGDYITPFYGNMPQPDSDDSYNRFIKLRKDFPK